MTWTAPEVRREDPPMANAERAALESWLDFHRKTLLFKCSGLTSEQLVTRAAEPSTLTLLGLVRHMSEVERGWFRRNWLSDKSELDLIYCSDEFPDGDFDLIEPSTAEADFAIFAEECRLANETASARSLDDSFPHSRSDKTIDLRWVYLHMIEEYARHNGHADILREKIDGVTGD